MKTKIILFVDSELGNKLWKIKYDSKKYNFEECFETAKVVMYGAISHAIYGNAFETAKAEYPNLTRKDYDIACQITDNGNYGITDDRFCEFLTMAFGFACDIVNEDIKFDVERGKIVY